MMDTSFPTLDNKTFCVLSDFKIHYNNGENECISEMKIEIRLLF